MFRLPLWPVRSPLRSIRRVLSPYRVVKPHRRGPLARRALLWAVAIYGVAHLLLAVVAASSRWIRDPIYTDKRDKLVRLQRQYPASRERVVFLGTSRVGNGFAAGHCQELLQTEFSGGGIAFNWGLPASGPVTHLFHFRRMLAEGIRPTVLLLEVLPATWAELPDGPLEARFSDGLAWDAAELAELAAYGCPAAEWQRQRRQLYLQPWHALRFRLLGRVAPSWLPFHLRYDWSRGPDPHGWSPLIDPVVSAERRQRGQLQARREYEHVLRRWRPGMAPLRAARDLLELCRQQHIPVALVLLPEGPSYRQMYTPASLRRLEVCLQELTQAYGCRLIDCRRWMEEEDFVDGHHLLPASGRRWTERLTREELQPWLAEQRR